MSAQRPLIQRLQGTDFKQIFNPQAARIPIMKHADVQRMLLDMKGEVEGCRSLIYFLAQKLGQAQILEAMDGDEAKIARDEALVSFLTPIVKSYVSDAAWEVAGTAIQVHGGYGYLREFPVEQYARDVKILSIWEGTNHVQASDFVREKLGFGRSDKFLSVYLDEIQQFLNKADSKVVQELGPELERALEMLECIQQNILELTRERRMETVLLYANSILEIFAIVTLSWRLLISANVAQELLKSEGSDANNSAFYEGKILVARHFFEQKLPKAFYIADIFFRSADTPLSGASVLYADIEDAI